MWVGGWYSQRLLSLNPTTVMVVLLLGLWLLLGCDNIFQPYTSRLFSASLVKLRENYINLGPKHNLNLVLEAANLSLVWLIFTTIDPQGDCPHEEPTDRIVKSFTVIVD